MEGFVAGPEPEPEPEPTEEDRFSVVGRDSSGCGVCAVMVFLTEVILAG